MVKSESDLGMHENAALLSMNVRKCELHNLDNVS